MHRMEYYDFWRHYSVKAYNFKEARISFSRALEERTEDQYYVETKYQFPSQTGFSGTDNKYRMSRQILRGASWFLEEVIHQIFGYPEDTHSYSQ